MNSSGCVCIRGVDAYLILIQMRCLHTGHSSGIRKNIQKIPVTSVLEDVLFIGRFIHF